MNKWRLVSEIRAIVIAGTDKIYFSAPEKKSYINAVIHSYELELENWFEIRLSKNIFKIKLEGTSLYISSPELPPEIEWYRAENFCYSKLEYLIKYHKIDHGKFDEEINFEVIFNDDIPDKFAFISKKCDEYENCLEEMIRKFNCEIYKKTKNWIPGHRYDTPDKSIFYLFSINSHLVNLTNSEYYEGGSEVYVCTEKTPHGKTISEVLNHISFDDIVIYFNNKLCVDSGEYLKNDYTNYQDYIDNIIENTKDTAKIKNFLNIFSIGNIDTVISPESKKIVEDIIRKSLLDIIIKNWQIPKIREDQFIGKFSKDNEKNLKKLFLLTYIEDTNFSRVSYYETLLKVLKIDLEKLILESLLFWNSLSLDTNFDEYIKYIEYFKLRDIPKDSDQRELIDNINSKRSINTTLKYILGPGELTDTIIELIKYSSNNHGFGIKSFQKISKSYITATVTIEDIIKYKKGISGMSENLKNDILQTSFVSIQVSFPEFGINKIQ